MVCVIEEVIIVGMVINLVLFAMVVEMLPVTSVVV